jgi:hypothetical protein
VKKQISKFCAVGTILSLLALCSCATIQPPLPAEVSMNKEAGRGGWLIVMVRLESGEPLPFIVDTGCPVTCLDKSLEPKLGKRLTDAIFLNLGVSHRGGAHPPPRLYLENTPLLKAGTFVVTMDCKPWSAPARLPFLGSLGMDVLKHYCIQLDFQNGQLRFLDSKHANKKDWGKPVHLTNIGDGCIAISENLVGAKGPASLIDTGCDHDGFLATKLFQQWTNHATPPANGEARAPNGTLGGETYHELDLSGLAKTNHDSHSRFNIIGLHVLSQNLVTLDFPERTMYLKRTSDWPLANKDTEAAAASVAKSAAEFSKSLKQKGQLPGWAQNDSVRKTVFHFHYTDDLDFVTFDEQKEGDLSVYHYTFTRASQNSPWRLQKAWRTDQDNKMIQEFPVP